MAEDPVRSWDEEQGELMRSLLAAAREDQPQRVAIERTLTVLGVGTALTTASAIGSAAGLASSAAAPGLSAAASASSAQSALGTTLLMVVKWLGAGVVVGLLTTSVAYVATPPNVSVSQAPSQKPALAKPTTPHRGAPAVRAAPVSAPEVAEAPVAARSPASPSAEPSAAAAPAVSGVPTELDRDAQLAAELSMLDSARQALARGNASSAVRLLNDYDARFAHPTLLPEALYLRLEALTMQGDQPEIQAVARRLLRSSPGGPHAARARGVFGLDK
jgi:hypothetical protein